MVFWNMTETIYIQQMETNKPHIIKKNENSNTWSLHSTIEIEDSETHFSFISKLVKWINLAESKEEELRC